LEEGLRSIRKGSILCSCSRSSLSLKWEGNSC